MLVVPLFTSVESEAGTDGLNVEQRRSLHLRQFRSSWNRVGEGERVSHQQIGGKSNNRLL